MVAVDIRAEVAVGIREEVVVDIQAVVAAIRGAADNSSRKEASPRSIGRLPQMTLLSSTRCWTSCP